MQEKIGIHSQTFLDKRAIGRLGGKSQGKIPWTDSEEKRILELTSQKEFQRKSRINAQKIAIVINNEFHNSEPVRDNTSVKKVFIRAKNAVSRIMLESESTLN
jgi:hypothetical protein